MDKGRRSSIKKLTKTTQKYIEENNLSVEQFFEQYHPNIISLIEQEKVWTIDKLKPLIHRHTDYNMIVLYEDNPLYPRYGYPINEDNLERYNLINVVAFNASMDKIRQYWGDIPERSNGDFRKRWPECDDLYNMIMCGVDQGLISRQFPKAFKEYTILPIDVEGRELLIEKYTSRVMPHRKFVYVDQKGNEISPKKLNDMLAETLYEQNGYDIEYLLAPEDVPQTSNDTEILD